MIVTQEILTKSGFSLRIWAQRVKLHPLRGKFSSALLFWGRTITLVSKSQGSPLGKRLKFSLINNYLKIFILNKKIWTRYAVYIIKIDLKPVSLVLQHRRYILHTNVRTDGRTYGRTCGPLIFVSNWFFGSKINSNQKLLFHDPT